MVTIRPFFRLLAGVTALLLWGFSFFELLGIIGTNSTELLNWFHCISSFGVALGFSYIAVSGRLLRVLFDVFF
ncbi:hypothetical protein S4054249_25215 [Pseudoalteromonas luteoviolacea]|uniref:Uncharacterized protein n=1 Tax=Pseudoalteromonas luteoviolacea S4054 TaxID=1129367 RepID=A0A0F6AA02_9GAMM|nr:hypothetical protein S4054249_25215 [Pseudoalteromonas luteoviolacea]AOT15701.1 hypothetical protein S40542_23295 [Pseudoalteromonas luteoviolacea]AOT20956.1 hypothetical protein S4054_25135 [Pseudoalteromonas luteoviolacea]KKE82239.1 hypothetical protein N479_19265 [Pseudoalteromonas luteoviolacea S4054]KZN65428.1 hypothetical protein N481_25065 [Pseudoalteromonas luteoviolacea S4047-1]